jgi:hypothetical protein
VIKPVKKFNSVSILKVRFSRESKKSHSLDLRKPCNFSVASRLNGKKQRNLSHEAQNHEGPTKQNQKRMNFA